MKKHNWITCPNCMSEVLDLQDRDQCPYCYQIVKGVEASCPSVWADAKYDCPTTGKRFKKLKEVKMKPKKYYITHGLKEKRGRPRKDDRLYVISSTKFKNLKEAKVQMYKWVKDDSLYDGAMIYEVKRAYKFRVITDVKEVKI